MIIRQLGSDASEDVLHFSFSEVVLALRENRLNDPSRLLPYTTSIVRRNICRRIRELCKGREKSVDFSQVEIYISSPEPDPETRVLRSEARQMAADVLRNMSARDFEILRRFYVLEHSEEEIRRDMGLTYTGFRNVKHRAKDRFTAKWIKHAQLPARRGPASAQPTSKTSSRMAV